MRLFFALWPEPLAAAALRDLGIRLAGRVGGKPVPPEKIHLTLAFLGDIAPERLDPARAAAAAVQCPAFEVELDEVGSFRGARVAWAGSREAAPPLLELQSALARELAGRGFALDDRSFAAHVTLVRKITRPLARVAGPAIRWQARELCLVESETGKGSYRTLARWRLG